MHSIIIQLEKEKVKKEDLLKAYHVEDDMITHTPADYVYDFEKKQELEEGLCWFLSAIEPYGAIYDEEDSSIIFLEGFKSKYFKQSFEKMKELAKKISLEEFSGETSDRGKLYKIGQLINDQFDFYIYQNFSDTMSDFIRYMEEDEKYYIGSIIGYHA